jgi:HEAT repeats
MNPADQSKKCAEIAPLLVFYVCEEVDERERTAILKHLAECTGCREQLAEEQSFHQSLDSLPQAADHLDSSNILLSQCRSELAEKLDDLARPPVFEKAPGFGLLRRWMALRPAWSGALLIVFGLLVGVQFSQWFTGRNNANALDQAVNVRPSPRISDDQLSKMAVAGINFTPNSASGMQNVRVQLSAEEPVELNGSLDDTDVRRVLTYVVKNGERFDSGVRLDCLDALKARSEDMEVRTALLSAARKDQNPAVRLKALEALRESVGDHEVRETLLQALKHDANPGVRVEAVNLLVRSLETERPETIATVVLPEDGTMAPENLPVVAVGTASGEASLTSVIRALEDLQHSDPSRYVRLRSAAALRQINARNDQ